MWRLVLSGFGAVLIGLTVFFYVHSKNAVMAEVIAASRHNDVAAFARRVDWEGLRAALKTEIAEKKASSGEYGRSTGPDVPQIGKIVDYYVQPENIAVLYHEHAEIFPQAKEEDFIDNTGYFFPFGFQITLGYPKSVPAHDMAKVMQDRLKVTLIFQLQGLTWKLRRMDVPLFMVPRQTYDRPATEIFGASLQP
jgi:hypothetical protein